MEPVDWQQMMEQGPWAVLLYLALRYELRRWRRALERRDKEHDARLDEHEARMRELGWLTPKERELARRRADDTPRHGGAHA